MYSTVILQFMKQYSATMLRRDIGNGRSEPHSGSISLSRKYCDGNKIDPTVEGPKWQKHCCHLYRNTL